MRWIVIVIILVSSDVVRAESPLPMADASFEGTLAIKSDQRMIEPRTLGAPALVEGFSGQAVVVGGKDRLLFPAQGLFNPKRGTCMMWIQPIDWDASSETFQFLFSLLNEAAAPTDWLLYKVHNRTAVTLLQRSDGTARSIDASILFWQPGQWHHLAFTWDEQRVILYVDGRKSGEMAALAMPAEGWTSAVLGTAFPGWAHLGEQRTAIDELRLYAEPLEEQQIAAHFAREAQANPVTAQRLEKQQQIMQDIQQNNLALAKHGAAVITSSFANYTDQYSNNLIDGRLDTAWRSFDEQLPHWIELRWDYPVTVDRVALHQTAPSRISAVSIKAWDGLGQWREVAEAAATFDEDDRLTLRFAPTSTDRLRVIIEQNDGPRTQLAELGVYGPPQINVGSLRPFWRGWHLWYPEPEEKVLMEPRYFRKRFVVEEPVAVRSAFVQLYTNDLYEVFINGTKVAEGFKTMAPVAIGAHLRRGDNIIAVTATPASLPSWRQMAMNAEITLNTAEETFFVATDESWRVSRGADGADSVEPLMIAPVGEGVWGRIGYTDCAAREKVTVTRVEAPAEAVRPGETARLRLYLRPAAKLHNDHAFVYDIGEDPVLHGWGDFIVCKGRVAPEQPTSTWPTDRDTAVDLEIRVPAYAPEGASAIRVEALNLKRGRNLTLVGADGKPLNHVGDLLVRRFEQPMSHPSTTARATLDMSGPTPAFIIDGQRHVPLAHAYFNPTYEKIHTSARTGIHLYHARGYPLKPDGTPATFDRTIRLIEQHILCASRVDPDARFIVFFDLRPSPSWLKQHPEAALITAFGKSGPQSYFSKEHEAIIVDELRRMVRYFESQPYAGRIFTYHPMTCGTPDSVLGGVEDNLFVKDRAKLTLGDYNPQAIAAFRGWLRERYERDEPRLRQAWHNEAVTFDTAQPNIAALVGEPFRVGVFHHPADGAMASDYLEFLSGAMFRFYRTLGEAIRAETGPGKLLGHYFGYEVEHLRGYNSVGSVHQNNNFVPDELRPSDPYDYKAVVSSYNHRLAGSHLESQEALDSLALRGKLYLAELDIRTFTADTTLHGRQRSLHESREMLKRDLGGLVMEGRAGWFADWAGPGVRGVGYFSDPDLMQVAAKSREIYEQTAGENRDSQAQIAVFVSGAAWRWHDVLNAPPIYHNLIAQTLYRELSTIGAPYDVFRLEDADNPAVQERYKLYIFLNAFAMTAKDLRAVESLKRDGKTLLWFYAPGFVRPGEGLSAAGIEQITGLGVRDVWIKQRPVYHTIASPHPLLHDIAPDTLVQTALYGQDISNDLHPPAYAPQFLIDDPYADALGLREDGTVALAARDFGSWKSVYSAAPIMPAALLRNVARYAGVHLYVPPGVVCNANGPFLLIHQGYGGLNPLPVQLPVVATRITDLYTGEIVAENTDTLQLPADTARTWLLRIETQRSDSRP